MKVEIKQRHIQEGDQSEKNTCAIALALKEAFDADEVSVEGSQIVIKKEGMFEFIWNNVPEKINKFIEAFDADKRKAKPFSFTIPFLKPKK